MKPRILIVGNPEIIHVGAHFYRAAQQLGLFVEILDIRKAYAQSLPTQFVQKFLWHKPFYIRQFDRTLRETVQQSKPKVVLVTGIAPVDASTLKEIRKMVAVCVNYLTDDPWNPAHHALWFVKTLPFYDAVYSPRRDNLLDLKQLGCKSVYYLPFAYEPDLHYPEREDSIKKLDSDLVFIGGADKERLPWIRALIQIGAQIRLYGGYWNQYPETKAYSFGYANPKQVRRVVAGAKVALCLVRQANRDGHSMRTFELPAMGACMLTEDTQEHREIFGPEGDCVVYFKTIPEMVQKLRWLLDHDQERDRLSKNAHNRITQGKNTYQDRLQTMLNYTAK